VLFWHEKIPQTLINYTKSNCLRVDARFDANCTEIVSLSGHVLRWSSEMRYLGVNGLYDSLVSIGDAKRSFYRAANSITRGSHSFTCHPHTNHTCLYSPAASRHRPLVAPTHEGMARLSWLVILMLMRIQTTRITSSLAWFVVCAWTGVRCRWAAEGRRTRSRSGTVRPRKSTALSRSSNNSSATFTTRHHPTAASIVSSEHLQGGPIKLDHFKHFITRIWWRRKAFNTSNCSVPYQQWDWYFECRRI